MLIKILIIQTHKFWIKYVYKYVLEVLKRKKCEEGNDGVWCNIERKEKAQEKNKKLNAFSLPDI